MSRRHSIAAGVMALAAGIAVADNSTPKRPVNPAGPLAVYRDNAAFDPNGRLFELWGQPVLVTEIHRNLVEEFIRRPGAGVNRMPPQFVPQEWIELVPDSLSESHTPTTGAPPQSPRYDAFSETLTLADGSQRKMQERVWLLRDQRLMSVEAKIGPAVYLLTARAEHDILKEKPIATGKNARTRKLDDFETKALARLRAGSDVVVQTSTEEMRVLGAIRARKECLECHQTDVGHLLGAFSYTLAPQSVATPEADCLKDTAGLSRAVVAAVRHVESLGGKAVRTPGGSISEVDYTFTAKKTQQNAHSVFYVRLKNSALDVLESFPDLRVLDISHSMVTDAGLKEIAKLKTLQRLVYTPGYVTDAGIAELKKSLPGCAIETKTAVVLP